MLRIARGTDTLHLVSKEQCDGNITEGKKKLFGTPFAQEEKYTESPSVMKADCGNENEGKFREKDSRLLHMASPTSKKIKKKTGGGGAEGGSRASVEKQRCECRRRERKEEDLLEAAGLPPAVVTTCWIYRKQQASHQR